MSNLKQLPNFSNYFVTLNENETITVTNRYGKVLTPSDNGKGYKQFFLTNDQGERKSKYIHVIGATLFVANPNNYPSVNHIDGNPSNNKISNYEFVTQYQNFCHGALKRLTTSKYMGVNQVDNGKFRARIKSDGKYISLGYYFHEADAALAYLRAAIKMGRDLSYYPPITL